jgi:hypothetical protein
MFLGISELLLHGGVGLFIQRSRGLSIYNPGLATAVVLAATSISYSVVITSNDLIYGIQWLWAFLYFFGSLVVGLLLPEFGLKNRESQWAFDGNHLLGYYKRYTSFEKVMGRATAT